MNIKTIVISTALLLSAGSTFAQAIDGIEAPPASKSTLTRAEVQQELRDAMAKGTFTESGYVLRTPEVQPSRSRAAVERELSDAMAKGTFTEAGYVLNVPEVTHSRSRAEVRAEAIASVKHHELNDLYTRG